MAVDRRQEAFWRFEQIAPLLDAQLPAAEKVRIIKGLSKNDVRWPGGYYGPIKPATIYNWLARYRANPCVESLMRKKRTSPQENVILPEWIAFALVLLDEEQMRSLDNLCTMIREHFALEKVLSKSSLHRALINEPKYKRIRGGKKLRGRFSAIEVHQIWQTDAKAEATVHFADGTCGTYRLMMILDDASRYIVAAALVRAETERAAIMLFRLAVIQYGLCASIYMDRGSCYDAYGFRLGIAVLGVRRLDTRPANPAAHGKIEKTNQTMGGMFVLELKHRTFKNEDEAHAFLEHVIQRYHQRKQRTLGMTPEEAFTQMPRATRHVSVQDLHKAFLMPRTKKLCRKTHHLELKGVYYTVPEDVVPNDRRLHFLLDMETGQPYLEYGTQGIVPLKLATRHPAPTRIVLDPQALDQAPPLEPQRQSLHGRSLPQASRGFGLPEIYALLSQAIGRQVPYSDRESDLIVGWLKAYGPFDDAAFQAALNKSLRKLGTGTCLVDVIDDLTKQIRLNNEKKGKSSL